MPYERLEGEGSYYVEKVKGFFITIRHSRRLIVIIVFIAIFLDNMLLTTVVPILPEYLFELEHPELKLPVNQSVNVTELVCERRNVTADIYDPIWNATEIIVSKYPGEFTPLPEQEVVCRNVSTEEFKQHKRNISAELRHQELTEENVRVGILFASKAVVQLITNPFVGSLTNKIGYSIPMFSGFIIIFISTVIFAIGSTYPVLFVARAIQGIGSSCSSVSGMGMLADRYPDDRERGEAMGFALGGLALGVLRYLVAVGPPFGGVMYEFVGKEAPFLILAVLALADGLLQLYALQPSVKPEEQAGTPLLELIKDPLILVTAGAIMIGNMGIAMMEPSLPIWMIDTMNAPRWQQGVAFLPCSISYLIGTNIFGPMAHKIGRWLTCMIGLVLIGIALLLIPLAKNIGHLIAPNFCLGFAIGMVDSSMMPQMGYLVDIRHVSVYGSVYAIADVAFCMGYAIGPSFGGSIVQALSFPWMLYLIAIVSFLYSPLLIILRNPQPREEKETLVINGAPPVKYVSYNQNSKSGSIDYDDSNYIQETQIP